MFFNLKRGNSGRKIYAETTELCAIVQYLPSPEKSRCLEARALKKKLRELLRLPEPIPFRHGHHYLFSFIAGTIPLPIAIIFSQNCF
jgi:hypothetical protein